MTRNRSSTTCSSADALKAATAAVVLFAALPALGGTRPSDRLFLAHPYPIEAAPSFPGGLFHWIDSLAGTSIGKTVPAHREQYIRLFGEPSDEDKAQLRAFIAARAEHADSEAARAARLKVAPRASAMLGVFCGSATVEDALSALQPELSRESWDGLVKALAHFRPRYEVVWNDGALPKAFLERVRRDPTRGRLEALLAEIVRFYHVDPLSAPPPRLALVPVPSGYGTHAEAIGSILLLEIRRGDGLPDEASVIVHENSHFLWSLVSEDRKRGLAEAAAGLGEASARTFRLFGEAIPTALGQGAADRAFRPSSWSESGGWYHTEDVDQCAKRIYPVVQQALDTGLTLDAGLVLRALRAASPPP